MKKQFILAALFVLLALGSFAQKGDPYLWTVTNDGRTTSPTCTYEVCLKMATRNTTTGATSSGVWICHTIAPGTSATFSMGISPAPGYEIVVIDAKATFASTTITGLGVTPGTSQIDPESCNGGNFITMWEYTGTRSFSIREDLILGGG